MQELTMQDFKVLVEKITKLADKEGLEYETPFRYDGFVVEGFLSHRGDVLFRDGEVIYALDEIEQWIEFHPRYYEDLDDLAEALWVEISAT